MRINIVVGSVSSGSSSAYSLYRFEIAQWSYLSITYYSSAIEL
jgi:hypothetical protein